MFVWCASERVIKTQKHCCTLKMTDAQVVSISRSAGSNFTHPGASLSPLIASTINRFVQLQTSSLAGGNEYLLRCFNWKCNYCFIRMQKAMLFFASFSVLTNNFETNFDISKETKDKKNISPTLRMPNNYNL